MTALSWVLGRVRPRTFRAQVVASTMVLMALLVLAVGLVLQVLLTLTANHEVDSVLAERSRTVVGLVSRGSGPLMVPDGALDPGEVVYDQAGDRVAGSVERRAADVADDQATTDREVVRDVGEDLRMRATPFTTASGDTGVVVITQETTPYERSEHYSMLATVALGLIAVGTTGLIAGRVTTQALRPVQEMAETASEWSETDLKRRFGLGAPTNEITALGETLDHLLERVARAIRSEQRLTSELAHELRTPLTVIQGSADLALLRGVEDEAVSTDLEQISASAHAMSETISTLLDLARDMAEASSDTCTVADLVGALAGTVVAPLVLEDRTTMATVHAATRVAAPLTLCVRALAPLMDNAVRFARTTVSLSTEEGEGTLDLLVADDGPGIDPALADALFEPGTSGTGGTGLGLAIARRVARSLGGDVLLDPRGVVLRLPRA